MPAPGLPAQPPSAPGLPAQPPSAPGPAAPAGPASGPELPARLPPVVGPGWVAAHLDELVLADVRWYLDGRSGHRAYLAGHLPGAVWVDVDTDLSAPPSTAGGRHPLPEPEEFARRLGRLGIADDDTVVAYDDRGGGFAARLVWLLRRLGRPAALLDGGLAGWTGPRATGQVERPAVVREPRAWPPDLLRTADDTQAAAASPSSAVLDSRAAGRYSGADALPGETRLGHVPGALSAPWTANLAADGRFLSPGELRSRFAELGVAEADEVIVHCGSGVTACHNLLALEYAGLPGATLFVGSWSAWSADGSRPVVTGDLPAGAQPDVPDGVPAEENGHPPAGVPAEQDGTP
ncbi:sulfurtransferase [Streptomyces sp. NBC_01477]|nr:sulfurtransferase [Streptomyces sp. NBC_01477]